jgi:hypothetical protein
MKNEDLLKYIGTIQVSPTPGVHVMVRRFKVKGDEGPILGYLTTKSNEYPRWYGACIEKRWTD